jgi:hypothetical protein
VDLVRVRRTVRASPGVDEIGLSGPAYPRGYKNIGVDARESFEVRDTKPAQEIRGQLLAAEPEAMAERKAGPHLGLSDPGPLEERAR